MTQEHVPNWDEIRKQLAVPFHSYYVGWKGQATTRDKTRALAVPYVDARTVMDRLDQAVGMGNWSDAYRLVSAGDGEFAIECTLTILGVSKADVGTANEHDDGSQASISKSAYSDALKRAAVKWGIARYLYRVPRQWVGYDAARKQLAETPELPGWALPKDERDSSDGHGGSGSDGGIGRSGNGRRAPTNGRSTQAAEASSPPSGDLRSKGVPVTTAAPAPQTAGSAIPSPGRVSSTISLDGSLGSAQARTAQGSATAGGNGKNGDEMSLEQARATVLPFGTRDHPEWKGKSLAEVSALNIDLIAWLASEFNPTSKGGTTVQKAAQVMAKQAPVAAKAA